MIANSKTRQQGTYIITVTDDYSRYTSIYLLEVRSARHDEGIQKYKKQDLEYGKQNMNTQRSGVYSNTPQELHKARRHSTY
jgi:hypothetical protein